MNYDLVIKKGTVLDPSQGIHARRDVAFANGAVAALAPDIPEKDAAHVLDASGLLVVPGLVDLHVHVFWGGNHYGVEPDIANISRGVTTALDAGSSGALTFDGFRRFIVERAKTRLFALLNISSIGLGPLETGELFDIRFADVEKAVATARANRDVILGIKARLARHIAADNDVAALQRAQEAAEAFGGFMMAHVGNTARPLEELTAMLRPGDVVTHTFHGLSHGILDDAGKVIPGILEARKRGVVFDVGHGAGSFSFRVAEKAFAQGFFPDNISSDVHRYNIEGPVFDQVTILSRFLHMGMSLEDVIRLSTHVPAKIMGVAEHLGTLRAGAVGDAAVLRIDEGKFTLTDAHKVSVTATKRLTHVHTVRAGRVYRHWDHA
ncbi:MAG: amidohydrolase/deacetylase family metallohydrolase [SAR202 cluster bacterium]|nr:amidohydrolase/deacetylase family metallohydrolase [SAR202 cluster bacterium]